MTKLLAQPPSAFTWDMLAQRPVVSPPPYAIKEDLYQRDCEVALCDLRRYLLRPRLLLNKSVIFQFFLYTRLILPILTYPLKTSSKPMLQGGQKEEKIQMATQAVSRDSMKSTWRFANRNQWTINHWLIELLNVSHVSFGVDIPVH